MDEIIQPVNYDGNDLRLYLLYGLQDTNFNKVVTYLFCLALLKLNKCQYFLLRVFVMYVINLKLYTIYVEIIVVEIL